MIILFAASVFFCSYFRTASYPERHTIQFQYLVIMFALLFNPFITDFNIPISFIPPLSFMSYLNNYPSLYLWLFIIPLPFFFLFH